MGKEIHPAALEFGQAFVNNAVPKVETQTNLAKTLRVSDSFISKVGNGTHIPSPEIVGRYLEKIPLSETQIDQLFTPYSVLLERKLVPESHIHIPEGTRKKMSEAHKGKPSPMKGKTHSEKARERISGAMKGRPSPHKGKPRSEETKRRIGEAHKGKTHSEDTRKKMSEAHKGKPSPHKGRPRSEETKRRIGEGIRRAAERRRLAKLTPLEPGIETLLEA